MCLAMANNEFSEICTLSVQDFRIIVFSILCTNSDKRHLHHLAIYCNSRNIVFQPVLHAALYIRTTPNFIQFSQSIETKKKKRKFNATTSQKSKSLQINASSKIRAHYAGFEFHFILYVCFRSKIESKADNACVCFLFLFCHVFVVWLRFLLLLLVLLQKRSVEMRRSITKMSMHQLEQTLIIIAAKLLFFDVRHIITSSKQSMHRDVRLNWFMTHSLILFFFSCFSECSRNVIAATAFPVDWFRGSNVSCYEKNQNEISHTVHVHIEPITVSDYKNYE